MLTGRLVAGLYDRAIRRVEEAGLRERRHALLAELEGNVLEIGAGTGLNLEHYERASRLVLLEPDPHMRRRLEERASRQGARVRVVDGSAEALPFPDESFHAVVSTLVLCSVGDLPSALSEILRVLRPGGRLVLIEHVRGEGARSLLQDLVAPPSRFLFGCSPNRRTADGVRAVGFQLQEERFSLEGSPPWTRPAFQGVAAKPPRRRDESG